MVAAFSFSSLFYDVDVFVWSGRNMAGEFESLLPKVIEVIQ